MEIQKAKELRDKLQEDILSLIQQFEEDTKTNVRYVDQILQHLHKILFLILQEFWQTLSSEGFCSISWAEFKYCVENAKTARHSAVAYEKSCGFFKFLGGNAIQVLDFIAVSV